VCFPAAAYCPIKRPTVRRTLPAFAYATTGFSANHKIGEGLNHLLLHDPCVLVGHDICRSFLNCAQKRKRVWVASGAGVIYGSGTLELLL
jgi:hypothetical protein